MFNIVNKDSEAVHLVSVLFGHYCDTKISFWTLVLVLVYSVG